jgi:hypothetical protein
MLRRLHVLGQRGGKCFVPKYELKVLYFPREKHLKSSRDPSHNHVVLEVPQNYTSILGTFILVIFLEIFIHTQMFGCGQGGKQKKIYWVCRWISDEVCKISDVETYNGWIEKASIKIDTQKRNDHLLSLRPEKSSPELTHPKINLVY